MVAANDTEGALIERAIKALSGCNWTIGECASQWTQRFARGRSDADFGGLIGLSGDQVYQRRRVWETFADVHAEYGKLSWSHFYVALTWDDSAEVLQWANECDATVNEMKAWRRAQHGENLAEPADEGFPAGTIFDQDPPPAAPERPITAPSSRQAAPQAAALSPTSPAPAAEEGEYAPFSSGARAAGPTPPQSEVDRAELTAERILLRVCSAIEKCTMALGPEIIENFNGVPNTLQQRFITAVDELAAKAACLR